MKKIKFSKQLTEALSISLDKELPFALYINPGQTEPHFIAARNIEFVGGEQLGKDNDWHGFVLNLFHPQDKLPIGIPAELTAEDIVSQKDKIAYQGSRSFYAPYESTSPALYMAQVNKFVAALKSKGTPLKKAVLCRMVSAFGRPVIDVAQEYFTEFPNTFRYLYCTPLTGVWIGASPELLIDCDFEANRVSTMSLAGTQRIGSDGDWSSKNVNEHNIVTEYIVSALKYLGLEPEVSEIYARQFGEVVHLCNDISAPYNGVDLAKLLNTLSPTPALCGWPKREAMQLIENTEAFDRLCYGGWIGTKDAKGLHTFVNLRCAVAVDTIVGPIHYCVFTGGGIMPDSNYREEWEETANKAIRLCSIISLPDDTQPVDELTDFSLTINPEFSNRK